MTIKSKVLKVMSWAVGAVLVSSIAWAAVNWKVDSFGNIKVARSSVLLQAGETSNCKLKYSGSTLSIVGSDGNALSASNPCLVGMPNGAAPLKFTAPVSTTFGAASDTDGNLLGISEANWSEDMPWFLHACQGNTQNYFAFSRNPARISSGAAAADMCQKGDENCDDEGDMFIMASGLTLGDEVGKTCETVGSFRTTYATAGNAWTVTALTSQDGFGKYQENIRFWMSVGQNSAESGKYFGTSGGTASEYTTNTYSYVVEKNGNIQVDFAFSGDGGDEGSGNNYLFLPLPIGISKTAGSHLSGHAIIQNNSITYPGYCFIVGEVSYNRRLRFFYVKAGANTSLIGNGQNSSDRAIIGSISYNIGT